MYDLKITNGDLAVRGDGNITKIYGAERIVQDLSCWILEPFNTDPMYSRFGSTVWDMIGTTVTSDNLGQLKAEITRVINNYYEYQQRQISQAVGNGTFNYAFPNDEVIGSIDSIDVSAIADSVSVVVKLTMASGNQIAVEQII